jgi:acyl-CoA synthetase (AMP-forming)/AMP-acid ligase II
MNALRTPDRLAVEYREQTYTYAELNERVNQIAHGLLAVGLAPGERVACLFTTGLTIAEYYLAMAKIGLVAVTINPFWDDEQIASTVASAGVAAFVFDPSQVDRVTGIRAGLEGLRRWIVSGDVELADVVTRAALTRSMPADEPPLAGFDDDPMAICYTSGTTGTAKGIVHSHRSNLANSGDIWMDLPRGPDSVAASSTMLWGAGFTATLGSALFAGMSTVLQEDMGPAAFLDTVPRKRITHAITRPSFWSQLFREPDSDEVDLGSLRCVLLGSEPILPSLMQRIVARVPGCTMWSYFGTTEAPFSCFGRADTGTQDLGASGPARTTVAVDVVDGRGERLIDEIGEIRITGPHLMTGYLDRPDATAEALRDGWFYTGDLGVKDSRGVLTVRGRAQEAIRRANRWILPVEIEEVCASVPNVTEVGVTMVDGEDGQEILAAFVAADGLSVSPADVAQAVASSLGPEAKPDHIVCVDELPHAQEAAGPGKLLRREIGELWKSGALR